MEQLDLNLVRVFDVVYRTRNVSRAAELLGMSQPSTSQSLTRLRLALGDPLFERVRGGVRPTPRAEDLARSVQSGLAQIEVGLASESAFDPARSSAELRIHLTDIGEARFLPPLMREMRNVAPGCGPGPGRSRTSAQRWTAATSTWPSASCPSSPPRPMRSCSPTAMWCCCGRTTPWRSRPG